MVEGATLGPAYPWASIDVRDRLCCTFKEGHWHTAAHKATSASTVRFLESRPLCRRGGRSPVTIGLGQLRVLALLYLCSRFGASLGILRMDAVLYDTRYWRAAAESNHTRLGFGIRPAPCATTLVSSYPLVPKAPLSEPFWLSTYPLGYDT